MAISSVGGMYGDLVWYRWSRVGVDVVVAGGESRDRV